MSIFIFYPLVSVDELALTLETEELLALISELQDQLIQEHSSVTRLRTEVKNLGGSPSFW